MPPRCRGNARLISQLALGLLCAAAASAWPASDPAPGSPARSGPDARHAVVAVIPPDSPPTYFRDRKTGAASGFAVDVTNAVAARAGLRVTYLFEDSWADIIARLARGEADIAPGMGISAEREKELSFSEPIDAFPVSFFTRAGHGGLQGGPGVHPVGVIRGSVAFEQLKDRADLQVSVYEGFPQGLFDLLSGKIAAFACPAPTLWQVAREAGVEDHVEEAPTPIAEIRRAIAVRRGDEALLARLNAGIAAYRGTPAYRKVYAKWYGQPVPYWSAGRIAAAGALLVALVAALMAAWRYRTVVRLNGELTAAVALRRQSEAAVHEHVELLRSFLNAITEAAFVIDTGGRILLANETLALRFGTTVADLVGRSALDLLPPEVARRRRAYIDEAVRTGRPVCFEDERLGRVIDNSIYPVAGEDGRVVALAIVGLDITERKRTEEALRQGERRIREIAATLGEGVYVLDGRGEVTFMNPEAERLLGWSEAELRGRNIHDAVHHRRPDGTPLPFEACPMHTVVRTGVRYESDDEVFIRRDGAVLPVSVVSVPLREAGKVTASVTAFRDESERKRAQAERERLIGELQRALAEIKTLHGILPICSSCKKIRDDSGAWHQLEVYIRDRTDAEFSHGLCADCARKLSPRYFGGHEQA